MSCAAEVDVHLVYGLYIAVPFVPCMMQYHVSLSHCICTLHRIFRILDSEPSIPTSGGAWPTTCAGHIHFDSVSFAYPTRMDMPVLRGLTLDVTPFQTVALVGTSGSGQQWCCSHQSGNLEVFQLTYMCIMPLYHQARAQC